MWSITLSSAMIVMLNDLVDIIDWGFVFFPQKIFGGKWSVEIPVSSMLKISFGLLEKPLWVIRVDNSVKYAVTFSGDALFARNIEHFVGLQVTSLGIASGIHKHNCY